MVNVTQTHTGVPWDKRTPFERWVEDDLKLELQRGYAAGELRYRAAVLAQFPSFNLGFTRASDTGNIHTAGLGVSLSLPIFNRNRGPIAIEQALEHNPHVLVEGGPGQGLPLPEGEVGVLDGQCRQR